MSAVGTGSNNEKPRHGFFGGLCFALNSLFHGQAAEQSVSKQEREKRISVRFLLTQKEVSILMAEKANHQTTYGVTVAKAVFRLEQAVMAGEEISCFSDTRFSYEVVFDATASLLQKIEQLRRFLNLKSNSEVVRVAILHFVKPTA